MQRLGYAKVARVVRFIGSAWAGSGPPMVECADEWSRQSDDISGTLAAHSRYRPEGSVAAGVPSDAVHRGGDVVPGSRRRAALMGSLENP